MPIAPKTAGRGTVNALGGGSPGLGGAWAWGACRAFSTTTKTLDESLASFPSRRSGMTLASTTPLNKTLPESTDTNLQWRLDSFKVNNPSSHFFRFFCRSRVNVHSIPVVSFYSHLLVFSLLTAAAVPLSPYTSAPRYQPYTRIFKFQQLCGFPSDIEC